MPVITRDLADTWVWGVSSDPVKQMQMRAIARVRSSCGRAGNSEPKVSSSYCDSSDLAFRNFSRLAIKNLEHTWGLSVFNYGNESDQHWSNEGERSRGMSGRQQGGR